MGIIAINGRKQSGKDLVGKIIQYLLIDWNKVVENYDIEKPLTFEQYQNSAFNGYNLSGWQIRKFAGKLKEIIALLIGCSTKQLENEEFKNTELGEEWWIWKLTYLGKTKLFNSKEEAHKYRDDNFYGAGITELIKPTPRFLLQYLGTDLLRNQLHPDIWVNSLMSEYKNIETEVCSECNAPYFFDSCISCGRIDTKIIEKTEPKWIITDLRFPNELDIIKKIEPNTITIRINRNKSLRLMPKSCPNCGNSDELMYERFSNEIVCHNCSEWSLDLNKEQEHVSETALDNAEFDYVIDNNGTIKELIEKVKEILIKERLL